MDKSLVEKYRKEMLEKYGDISSAAAATYAAMNSEPTETEEKPTPPEKGRISAWVTSVANIYPVKNARVTVFTGSPDNMTVVDSCATDESGKTKEFLLNAPPKSLSMSSGAAALPYTLYNLRVSADGFLDNIHTLTYPCSRVLRRCKNRICCRKPLRAAEPTLLFSTSFHRLSFKRG